MSCNVQRSLGTNTEVMVVRHRRLRCVVVDDDSVFADSAAELLCRNGLTVVGVASESAEALSCVAALKPPNSSHPSRRR